ncbi:hypothetical protein KUC69_31740, partial [Pseudomonas aeruginosa]|uniref:hypothetical protein n=1 Tax=Pseudomonas aeruginosa TaxID=287 RepID=UPI0021E16AB6
GLLALAGVLGVGEGHLLHRKALRVKSADFAKSGSLFQSFPKEKGDRFIFTTIISATAHAKPLKANNSLNQSSLPRASRSLLTVSALEPLCSEN